MRARVLALLLGGSVLLALGGCQTQADIAIDLDETGRGRLTVAVELDDAAAQRVGDLTDLVESEDLAAAGWDISVAERRVLAQREIESTEDLRVALEEMGHPFSGLSFDRRVTFARTSVAVVGSVDLSQGVAAFGDEDLRRLTGSVTGVDVPPDALDLSLRIDLPGEEASNAGGPTARWDLPLGAVTPVEAESTDVNLVGLMAVGLSVLCAVALIVLMVIRLRA